MSCVVALLLPMKFDELRLNFKSLGNCMHVFEVYSRSLLKWARLMAMSAAYKSRGDCLS